MKIKNLPAAAGAVITLLTLFSGGCCSSQTPEYPLNGTTWVLDLYTLPEQPDPASRPLRPITLQINEENRTSGNAGVNRYLKSERAYLDALAAARSFRIDGRILTLFGEDGTPLAKFIAHTSNTGARPAAPRK